MAERKTPSDTFSGDASTGGPSMGDASVEPTYFARQIDASAMKAFAHPLRMAMYDYLNDREAATATMLAKHTGESTGQTSYHLRQLERHGFVEEDPGRGTGRERWWKAVGFRMDGIELGKDSATRPAVETMLHNQVAQRAESLREWYLRSVEEPEPWQTSSLHSRSTATMSADEADELGRALIEVIHEHTEAAKARHEAAGAAAGAAGDADVEPAEGEGTRRVRVFLDVFPLPED
ncbi:winged helix-turn-helix domain-containing protein [Ornithinimicrobium cryptoxanthini]|uniref:Helix-turn-helix domain-containing protein n=1 Tax=Ornithinimicrobium cryptoxanthini TaxID=2934161 RepID=A0ABY4YFZ2_9MICO|nr:helix-turn-helix domain-containing protein [Ornithinimicrobium cryptoxanthini]USQ75686.1 helix-turn-helix domain-containing protein [Ornithinimicrobium cryptoxanthini]